MLSPGTIVVPAPRNNRGCYSRGDEVRTAWLCPLADDQNPSHSRHQFLAVSADSGVQIQRSLHLFANLIVYSLKADGFSSTSQAREIRSAFAAMPRRHM